MVGAITLQAGYLLTHLKCNYALCWVELQAKVDADFTITEKAPTRAITCLKAGHKQKRTGGWSA